MWFGAHPADPAYVETPDEVSLIDVIAADPEGQLGFRGAGAFRRCAAVAGQGARRRRTPVAAGASERRAGLEGSGREERAGVPLPPERNYRDRSHKPEILVALGPRGAGPASGPRERVPSN